MARTINDHELGIELVRCRAAGAQPTITWLYGRLLAGLALALVPTLVSGAQSGMMAGALTIYAVLASLVLAAAAVVALRLRTTWVAAHEHGLVVSRLGRARSLRWDDLVEVVLDIRHGMGAPGTRWHRTSLRASDGSAVGYSLSPFDFPRLRDLERTTDDIVIEQFRPAAMARLETGAALDFGPVSVDENGLTIDGASAPWATLQRLAMRDGMIEAVARDDASPLPPVPVGRIPNLALLRAVASELIDRASPELRAAD